MQHDGIRVYLVVSRHDKSIVLESQLISCKCLYLNNNKIGIEWGKNLTIYVIVHFSHNFHTNFLHLTSDLYLFTRHTMHNWLRIENAVNFSWNNFTSISIENLQENTTSE